MTLVINQNLQKRVAMARHALPTREMARFAMDCLDLTSLKGDETKDDILVLCDIAKHNKLASVCIYPEHVKTAAKALQGSGVTVATVINFPTGFKRTNSEEIATPSTTTEDMKRVVGDGAGQADTVFHYQQFLMGNSFVPRSLLQAASRACPDKVMFKTIMETPAFIQEEVLRHACRIAIEHGSQCLKGGTGKHENGGTTLEAAGVMLEEAYRAKIGVKASGKIANTKQCAEIITLHRAIRGWDTVDPHLLRFGGSLPLFKSLHQALDDPHTPEPSHPVPILA